MSTRFTPGPWDVRHDHPCERTNASLAYIRPKSAPSHPDLMSLSDEIATIYGCDYDRMNAANAALIADAPAMFELLERLLHLYCDDTNTLIEDVEALVKKHGGEVV